MADVSSAPEPLPPPLANRRAARLQDAALLVALAVFAVLLFARLGHYALWDDEANTAIFASNLWHFHDLVAWDGTNIVAFRDGLELTGIKNRVFPPFQYLWAAPWLGLLGRTSFAARAPFALAALAGFALWAYWLRKEKARWLVQVLTFMGIVGNVSLFLYSRQSRYYALTWALSLAIVYLYVYRRESHRNRVLLVVTGMVLYSTQYLGYAALMVGLGLDYLFFEVWKKTDSWKERFIFLGSQVAFVGALTYFFNPLGRKVTPYVPADWWGDKLKLFWWNIRDLNSCEFFWPPMLGLAVLAFFAGRLRDKWLIRAVLGLAVYAFVASVLSQQPVGWANVSDIRYMAGALPLCIFIAVRALSSVEFKNVWAQRVASGVALAVAAAVFLTTWPHAWFAPVAKAPNGIEHRSTLVAWLTELKDPPRQAYREAADWLAANAPAGATVVVRPEFAVYPMMFHAPTLQYMWQFDPGRRGEYPMLPEVHFRFMGLPDYVVSFGPEVNWSRSLVGQLGQRGVQFEPEVRLDVAGGDRTRPELFWRSFTTTPVGNADFEATYIAKRRR